MSKYTEVQLEIMDAACLKDTLKAMGYDFEEHQEPQKLEGYLGDTREDKAHIIIKRRSLTAASNDLGFYKQPNGKYKMIISDYDRHAKKVRTDFMERLTKEYAVAKLKKQCLKMGATITQQTQMKDGRIKIKATMT